MKDSPAFIYVHKQSGAIRVESLETAKHIDSRQEWNHLSTINVHVVLEYILRATPEDRDEIIKNILR
jgi:hypothetical protein